MINIESDVLNKFIKKLTLEKMINEVSFEYKDGYLSVLTCDDLHQLIIDAKVKVMTGGEDTAGFMFTVGNIKEFYSKINGLEGNLSLEVEDQVIKINSETKELKCGLINPNLYHGIKSVYLKDIREQEISVSIRNQNVVYTDNLNITGKEFKSYLDQCKVIDSSVYLFNQTNNKIQLMSEAKLKRDSIKINLNLKNCFKNDKTYWIYNFVKYILGNNPDLLNVYMEKTTDPMLIHSKDESCEILYVIAPK